MSKSPLEWQRNHFDKGTDDYLVKLEELGVDDQVAYGWLVGFVEEFSSAKCTTPNGSYILSDKGE